SRTPGPAGPCLLPPDCDGPSASTCCLEKGSYISRRGRGCQASPGRRHCRTHHRGRPGVVNRPWRAARGLLTATDRACYNVASPTTTDLPDGGASRAPTGPSHVTRLLPTNPNTVPLRLSASTDCYIDNGDPLWT